MSPTLLSLVAKQHEQELRWWARCCAEGDSPSLARRWAARALADADLTPSPSTGSPPLLRLTVPSIYRQGASR